MFLLYIYIYIYIYIYYEKLIIRQSKWEERFIVNLTSLISPLIALMMVQ